MRSRTRATQSAAGRDRVDRAIPPAPEPAQPHRLLVLAVVVLAVLLVVAMIVVVAGRSLGPDGTELGPPAPRAAPPEAPAALPAEGALVTSDVLRDGSIEVAHWVRGADDIMAVALAAPPGPARATGVRLVAADGTILADDVEVGDEPRQVRFSVPTALVRATYVLRGAVDGNGTVAGRVRASAVSLDLSFPLQTGPTVVDVGAQRGGTVRSLACASARSAVELLRPCGSPDGPRWRVELPPDRRDDRVTAQVDFG